MNYRAACEASLALLRQGQDGAAQDLLEDALAGKWEPQKREALPTLELAFEDETPEIPRIECRAGVLSIHDDGWRISEETQAQIRQVTIIGHNALTTLSADLAVEREVRAILFEGVKSGRVRKHS